MNLRDRYMLEEERAGELRASERAKYEAARALVNELEGN